MEWEQKPREPLIQRDEEKDDSPQGCHAWRATENGFTPVFPKLFVHPISHRSVELSLLENLPDAQNDEQIKEQCLKVR